MLADGAQYPNDIRLQLLAGAELREACFGAPCRFQGSSQPLDRHPLGLPVCGGGRGCRAGVGTRDVGHRSTVRDVAGATREAVHGACTAHTSRDCFLQLPPPVAPSTRAPPVNQTSLVIPPLRDLLTPDATPVAAAPLYDGPVEWGAMPNISDVYSDDEVIDLTQ